MEMPLGRTVLEVRELVVLIQEALEQVEREGVVSSSSQNSWLLERTYHKTRHIAYKERLVGHEKPYKFFLIQKKTALKACGEKK